MPVLAHLDAQEQLAAKLHALLCGCAASEHEDGVEPWCDSVWLVAAIQATMHVMSDRAKWEPTDAQAEPTPPPLPDKLTRADLNAGLHYLQDQKRAGLPAAAAVLEYIDDLRADLARIPVGARSKHGTHRWTGHHWRENDRA